jgi:hypothetical protein
MSQSLSYLIQRLKPYWLQVAQDVVNIMLNEGPDIDLVFAPGTVTVGRGGDTILLFDSAGDPVAEWAATEAGLTAALAAATAGDRVEIPCRSITLTGVLTVPDNVTLCGMSRKSSIINTGSNYIQHGEGAYLKNLTVTSATSSAGELVGVKAPAEDDCIIELCDIVIENTGAGDAFGVTCDSGMAEDNGDLWVRECVIVAEASEGDGYAGRSAAGILYVMRSEVRGSTACFLID